MATEKDCLDLIENTPGREKTFAEFIAALYKDKIIEIYVGDSYEDIKFEQHSQQYPAVFCGKVVGAYKECLILKAAYSENKSLKMGGLFFVNERAVRALREASGSVRMSEMFLNSEDANNVVKKFG